MDKVVFEKATGRVHVTKSNGREYLIASHDNAHLTHRRGAFVVGDIPGFGLSRRTKSKVLKHFYPGDSLRYLEKFGYIAS